MDFHSEAQARFFEDTQPAIVERSKQTVENNSLGLLTNVEKGLLIGELAVDGVQTHNFLQSGRCHEVDPLAKPFVHSLPVSVVATSALAYAITRVHSGWFRSTIMGLVVVGEGLNILHNHQEGCE